MEGKAVMFEKLAYPEYSQVAAAAFLIVLTKQDC
jgi:hypothetical protein